ncbi:MAG TPA: hypothetical protein VGE30_00115, partial [Candidatus Saccharimonadales bacterium]
LVEYWHKQYDIEQPFTRNYGENDYMQDHRFEVHYPPAESGLTPLVHADIVLDGSGESPKSLADCINEAETAGSPFTQVMLPINQDTLYAQRELALNKFKVYGYIPGTHDAPAQLLYGRVRAGVEVVPTSWSHHDQPNPLWTDPVLRGIAKTAEADWRPAKSLSDLGLQ